MKDKIEQVGTLAGTDATPQGVCIASIAISLKRIADHLCKNEGTEKTVGTLAGWTQSQFNAAARELGKAPAHPIQCERHWEELLALQEEYRATSRRDPPLGLTNSFTKYPQP